jgi:hypothetical protein
VAAKSEIRLELLIGRRVFTGGGQVVGRLQECRAEREDAHWAVTEFDIGPSALFERLAVHHLGLGWKGNVRGYRARWDQLDLSDPDRPRLTCGVEELKALR